MKSKTVIFGPDPFGQGGIQSFCLTLFRLIKNARYVTVYPASKTNDIDMKFILPRNVFLRAINKISHGYIARILVKKWMKNNASTVIINSPKDLRYIPESVNKIILVQHATFSRWWRNTKFFGESEKLKLEVIKRCHIVTLSNGEQSELIANGFVAEKVTVIRNPCASIENKRNPGGTKSSNKLVVLSRLDNEVKNIDSIINKMPELQDYMLYIYGDGPDKEYLVNQSSRSSNVKFMGWVNDVKPVFESGSILVLTSRSECYPMSCIEAMNYGIPIILANTFPSATDIVHGNGVLLPANWFKVDGSFEIAVKNCESNYQSFSRNSFSLSKRHTKSVLSEQWKRLLEPQKI